MTARIAVPEGIRRARERRAARDASGELYVDGSIYEGMAACLVRNGKTVAHVVDYADAVEIADAVAASPRPDTPADDLPYRGRPNLFGERCNCGLPKNRDAEGEHHPFCLFKGPAGGDGGEREAVARIVDPGAVFEPAWGSAVPAMAARREAALAKVDRILALLAPASSEERLREAVNAEREACARAAEYYPSGRQSEAETKKGRDIARRIRARAALSQDRG